MSSKIEITEEEIKELVERKYKAADMAEHFNVSVGTIYRHLRLMKISLRVHCRSIQQGEMQSNVSGLLNLSLTERNDQNVLAPLSLFHIGGVYKLSGYGFVIHACIDVYSRFITYLDVSNNNNPSTVLRLFQSGVAVLGLPTRLRCDNQLENVGVAHFMDINRPLVSDRIVYQRSGGRLKNVLNKVGSWLQPFIDLIKDLESNCNLDQNSNFDLYCLNLCFIHLMKSHLNECRENWNNRESLKTTTPRRLSLIGLMSLKIRAGIDKAYYPELDQPKLLDVEQQDWEATEPPMDRANVDVREVKPIVEPNAEIVLGQLFQLKAVTIHTVSEVYLQMRRYLQSIYNSE
ncbi:uncharacterized protein LOC124337084 [Daphnia pulicaria]|uniref:uncharacterized protein LOC124337084 n=1 Tax=Daphnia pulicaria TaxID=35523 RepID=UPI001EEBE4E5|nr:uncharacterized protein LOC124337084 [Daphnia pulicaria]